MVLRDPGVELAVRETLAVAERREPEPPRAKSRQIGDIEALRAIAVLLVFLHHAQSDFAWWNFRWKEELHAYFNLGIGVDLFFAVSGFVIARSLVPLLRTAQAGTAGARPTVIAFWIRRFWRLTPAAWLWLLVPLLLCASFNSSGAFGTIRGNFLFAGAAVLNLANAFFRWILSQDGDSYRNSVFVYWSLSLEEQFYLGFPLLVLLFRRTLPLALIALIGVRMAMNVSDVSWGLFRFEGLLAGALLALWEPRAGYRRAEPTILASRALRTLFLLGSIALMSVCAAPGWGFPLGFRAFAVLPLAWTVVWVASYDRDYILRDRGLRTIARWIGARSYALYLTHVPAFFLIREAFFRISPHPIPRLGALPLVLFVLAGLVLPILLADMTYRFVELPLRGRGRAIADAYLAKRSS